MLESFVIAKPSDLLSFGFPRIPAPGWLDAPGILNMLVVVSVGFLPNILELG